MNAIERRVQEWLDGPYDDETKAQIRQWQSDNPELLKDAFYTDLSFGTGGLRGIMGVGSNRMNVYTVRRASQGLANYLRKSQKEPSVFIGFDSRHHSEEFALESARVLAANGVKVYLLKHLRPTPFISFGCRHKKCSAAIMITASHNPPEYNGYKVYWNDGAQVVPPHDTGIMKEVEAIHDLRKVKLAEPNDRLIIRIDGELDQPYIEAIRPLSYQAKQNHHFGENLKITYTSLHGTGVTLVPPSLKDWGFTNLFYVEEQMVPDGDFPTAKKPNPEYKETLHLGIHTLLQTGSDILLATDPDADRMAVVVRHHDKPVILTGNEIAAICVYYICETVKNKLLKKGAFITTIVSSDLIPTIARSYNIPCFEVLTGFKYIAEKIHKWETEKDGYHFLFGAEESYGYLLGTVARDKDAVLTSCFISEIALHLKLQNLTLVDYLYKIFHKFGIFREKQLSMEFEGAEGAEKMHQLMDHLRQNLPRTFGGKLVLAVEDYKKGVRDLPKSDVLLFRLEDESKIVIRPSGTEPKIKIYAGVREKKFHSIKEGLHACDHKLDQLLEATRKDLH